MSTPQYVQIPSDDVGKKISTSELVVNGNTVERQEMVIADSTAATGLAPVTAANGLLVDVSRVAGNVAVTNAGLTNLDVALSTRTKPADQQHTIVDSGTLTAVTAITNALPAGSNVIGHVINDTGSTTAVTGNVTVVQPTGTNLHVVVDTAPTTAVTVASLPLPSGAATSGNQTTEIASLASIDGKITTCNTGAVVVSSSALPSNAAQESSGNLAMMVALQQAANFLLQKQFYSQAPIPQGNGFIPSFEIPSFLGGF